jgi:hypothetical protein
MNCNELLRHAADALELVSAGSIWDDLVAHFGRALSVDSVLIGRFLPGSETKLRTLAAWHRGRAIAALEYELPVPFDVLRAQNPRVYVSNNIPDDLQNVWLKRVRAKSFGQVKLVGSLGQTWGALGFAHSKALESAGHAEAMLRIYGYRAAAELERELADERFYTQLLHTLQRPPLR